MSESEDDIDDEIVVKVSDFLDGALNGAERDEVAKKIESDPASFVCGFLSQADNSGSLCGLVQQALGRSAPGGGAAAQRFDPMPPRLVDHLGDRALDFDITETGIAAVLGLLAVAILVELGDRDAYEFVYFQF